MRKYRLFLLILAIVVNIISPVASYGAVEEDVSLYTMVDISAFSNAEVYKTDDDLSFYRANDIPDYFCWGSTYYYREALNKDSVREYLQDGVLYDKAGVPYSMPLEKAINVQGEVNPSTTIPLTADNYTKIHFLAGIIDISADTTRSFNVQVNYDDGTSELFYMADKLVNSRGLTEVDNFVFAPKKHTSNWVDESGVTSSFGKAEGSFNIYTYSIQPDSAKKTVSITFSSSYKATNVKVLAVTATTATESEIIEYRAEKMALALPDAESVTAENIEQAKTAVENLSDFMKENDISFSKLTEQAYMKYVGVFRKIVELNPSFKMVDISDVSNAEVYKTDDDLSFYRANDIPDYFCWGSTYYYRVALNKDSVKEYLKDGVLYDKAGVPYSMPLEKAINVQGEISSSTTIGIEPDNYKNIHFLAGIIDTTTAATKNMTVTVNYSDGTSETFDKGSELIARGGSKTVDNFVMSPKQHTTNWNKVDGAMDSFGTATGSFNIYTYSVNTDIEKQVTSITFSSSQKATNVKILAITAEVNSLNRMIECLAAKEDIIEENAVETQYRIAEIERYLTDNMLDADVLTENLKTKLNDTSSEVSYKYKKYELIDIYEYADSIAYIDSANRAISRKKNHDYFMYGTTYDDYLHVMDRASIKEITNEYNVFEDSNTGVPYLMTDEKAIAVQGHINTSDYTGIKTEFNPVTEVDMKNQKYSGVSFLMGIAESDADVNKHFSVTVKYTDGTEDFYSARESEELLLKAFGKGTSEEGYAFSVKGYSSNTATFNSEKTLNIFAYTLPTKENKAVKSVEFRSSNYASNPKVLSITGILAQNIYETAHSVDSVDASEAENFRNEIETAYAVAIDAIAKGWAEPNEFATLFALVKECGMDSIMMSNTEFEENEGMQLNTILHTLSEDAVEYTLVAAYYKPDGTLLGVEQCAKDNISVADGIREMSADLDIPEGGYVRFFLWNDGLVPLSQGEGNEETVIYVSPTGDDSGNGSELYPVRSLAKAQELVRNRADRSKRTRVIFREGTYYIDETVSFGEEDAGELDAPIIYQAAHGERVVFSGAKRLNISLFGEITDESILARLPEASRGKVKALNLADCGITPEMIGEIDFSNWYNSLNNEYTDLFLNSKEQPLSQWPNGEGEFAVYGTVIESGADGNPVFTYTGSAPGRWTTATDWYFYGFPSNEYSIDRIKGASVNPLWRTITLSDVSVYNLSKNSTKRWKAFNLLEEIDMPGEWYIDKNDDMMLYWYVPGELSEEDTLELASLGNPIIEFDQSRTSYNITFDGIEFSMARGGGINLGYSRDVVISNCIFHGFAANCIGGGGGDNISIVNNAFYNIDGHAIRISNYSSDFFREQDEFLIKNNYFYDCATEVGGAPHAVVIDDQYVTFEENTIHKGEGAVCLGNGAYSYKDKVLNNEIYNMVLQRSDVGCIYNRDGRLIGDRIIDGNYIHDFKPLNKYLQSSTHQYAIGIYMDDCCSGATITNNILTGGAGSGIQIGGGQNHLIEGNIIADMGKTPILTDNRGETWSNWADAPIAPSGNSIINNISDEALSINSRMELLGTVSGNSVQGFNLEDYQSRIDRTGCDSDATEKLNNAKKFKKNEPVFYGSSIRFTWENAVMADEFRILIARDAEMTDVVANMTVPYNYAEISTLSAGTYYWTVDAFNTGNSTMSQWGCSDGVGIIVVD